MSTIERLRTTLTALNLTAIDARLEPLLENASKKDPAYADFLLEVARSTGRRLPPPVGRRFMSNNRGKTIVLCH
jgi:hypothetical protein